MLLFSRFLGVSRRQLSFGISLGFGLIAGAELVMLAMNSGGLIGRTSHATYNLVNMSAYNEGGGNVVHLLAVVKSSA